MDSASLGGEIILSTSGGSGPNLLFAAGVGRDNHKSVALFSVRWSCGLIGRGVHMWCVRLREGDGEITRAGLLIITNDSLRCRCCCCCCWTGILFSLLSALFGIPSDIVMDLSGFRTTEILSAD